MDSKYLVIDKEILPDVFEKVIQVKELLRTGSAKEITEAVKRVGISRSTYYKYKDYVFTISEGARGKKVTIAFLLSHQLGVLSSILNMISNGHGNVLTINQDIPINNIANVSITFDISDLNKDFEELLNEIKELEGVVKLDLIAME
ncbi:MAG: ACT domain-containing protein [Halanaerobiales bacterium]|nr:ACT domain-containing protein [Halanaerobiales bacterium]